MAVRIAEVAKDDGLGGTSLLAGGPDFAVANRAVLLLRGYAGGADALDAVGAFFHDAAPADGDVRIAHRFQAGGVIIGVLEKIESPHLVGAVVRAITRADAAVVDHAHSGPRDRAPSRPPDKRVRKARFRNACRARACG